VPVRRVASRSLARVDRHGAVIRERADRDSETLPKLVRLDPEVAWRLVIVVYLKPRAVGTAPTVLRWLIFGST
jgi:hypothetical protein